MERKSNIAFISHYFDIGGIERTFLSIAESLTLTGRYTFHFINLSSDSFQNRFHACGTCFSSNDWNEVITYLQTNGIDIVQTGNCDEGSYLAYLAGVSIIIERPDGYSSAFLSDKAPVDIIVCSTRKVYHEVQRSYPHKYTTLIYNGVDTSVFKPEDVYKSNCSIDKNTLVIGYCGRIAEEKCLDSLIRVFAAIHTKHPHTILMLAGAEHRPESGYRANLTTLIHWLDINEHVMFIEPTESPQEIIALFDIGVLCSGSYFDEHIGYVTEGVPNSIMEEMAAGLPIVTTDSGETSTLVHHEQNGFIVAVDDWNGFQHYLEKLITDTPLREYMGKQSRAIIEQHFTLQRMAQEYDELYQNSYKQAMYSSYSTRSIINHFLAHEFCVAHRITKPASILLIRSAGLHITSAMLQKIKDIFEQYELSVLCTEANAKEMQELHPLKNMFIVHDDFFDITTMQNTLKELYNHKFDYLMCGINDLLGKGYDNVLRIVDEIPAKQKLVYNRLHRFFKYSHIT